MRQGLLEPRLYRAAFLPALFALVLLMFSLQARDRPLSPAVASADFSGTRAAIAAQQLVGRFGDRAAGSEQDRQAAGYVATQLRNYDFAVSNYRFKAQTRVGKRELTNVVGLRTGPSDRRLVVVASRDGLGGKYSATGAAETASLLELARVIDGRSFSHTIVLASTGGGAFGATGAAELAKKLKGPVDAVLVIRNISVERPERQSVLALTDSRRFPDQRLLRTAQGAVTAEGQRNLVGEPVFGQLVRLAFPVALGEQAVIGRDGLHTVAFSPGGERLSEAIPSDATTRQAGRSALRTLIALDTAAPPESGYRTAIVARNKVVPGWALSLFAACLLLPLIVTAVDAWARSRRRGRRDRMPPNITPLLFAIPFFLALLLARLFGIVGLIDGSPPLPVDPAALPVDAKNVIAGLVIVVVAVLGCVFASVFVRPGSDRESDSDATLALAVVASGLVVLVLNPVALIFVLVPLHVLVLGVLAETRPGRFAVVAMLLVGLIPLLAALVYYAGAFNVGLSSGLRFAEQIVSGGFVSPLVCAAGSLFAGCLIAAAIELLQRPKHAPSRTRGKSSEGLPGGVKPRFL